jgi:RecB family exonuclease
VPVYPYRVSAGIYPQYHFIINAAQTATTQISRRFPFLSIHEEALLSDTTLDLSDRIIALYLCSGTQISISYARRSFSGSQLPPAFFVTHNSEIETRLQPIDSLYQKEIQLWTGSRWSGSPCSDGHNLDGHSLTDLYDIQKKGFQAALTSVLAGPDINYTLRPIDKKPLRNRITDRYRHEDLLRISASSLETFTACAFRSLLQRGLKLKAWTDGQPLLEPIEIGTLLHRVFQSFFEDLDAALSGHKLEDFRQRMKDRVASILEQYVRCRPLPLLPLWQALEQWITELSQAYLEVEIAEYPDWKTLDTEKTLDWILPEKIQLTGTIDRIMEREGERALVDYKKKNLPSRGDLSGPRANSFQMPVYLALMEANGKPVQRALYYSIENKKYRTVTAPKGSGRMMVEAEDLPGLNKNMMDRVRDMADRINRGDYSIAGRMDTKACRYCDFEAVCRKKYSF